MQDWIENPFKSALAGTGLMVLVVAALATGISIVGLFV